MTTLILEGIVRKQFGHQLLDTPYEFRLEKLSLLKKLTKDEIDGLKKTMILIRSSTKPLNKQRVMIRG